VRHSDPMLSLQPARLSAPAPLSLANPRPQPGAPGCGVCRLAGQCLPASLEGRGNEVLKLVAQSIPRLEKGAVLHHGGSPFENLYVVQVGALKGIRRDHRGAERIVRFYLPGELVGLDAMADDRCALSVIALETTTLCRIPYALFQAHAGKHPALWHWLLRRSSIDARNEQDLRVALAAGKADQVLAWVLIDLGQRFAQGGLSATRLRLPMSRCELGSYLGLTPETMSRLFRRLVRQRVLAAERREIELLDIAALHRLAQTRPCGPDWQADPAAVRDHPPNAPHLIYAATP
jgi:CRP/FNR family transcriptional regulator, anaerobic regulatory protein